MQVKFTDAYFFCSVLGFFDGGRCHFLGENYGASAVKDVLCFEAFPYPLASME